MTIETKYNIGDEVWVRKTNYIEKGIIHAIDVSARMELLQANVYRMM